MPPIKVSFNPAHSYPEPMRNRQNVLSPISINLNWLCANWWRRFVPYVGALTLCSQVQYLSLWDIDMGGKGGKWNGIQSHAHVILFYLMFRRLKDKQATCQRKSWFLLSMKLGEFMNGIFILYYCMQERWPNMRLVSVGTHQAVSVVLCIFSFTLVVSRFFHVHSA